MIGSLQYASCGTRPDIAYIMSVLARYCGKPNNKHLYAAKRLFRYLKGTQDLSLTYTRSGNERFNWLLGLGLWPETANIFLLGDGAVTWGSKRQTSVALSTVEAEYMALSQATKEAVWLRRLLEELGKESHSPTTIMEDNQGAISTALNPVFHRKTKHIHMCYHYVRESIADNFIDVIC